MNPRSTVTQDFYGVDPECEYHQDYREGIYSQFAQVGFVLPVLLCLLPVIYQILFLLDYDLLPIPELLWNCLVYFAPTRLLDAIEEYQNPLGISAPALKHIPRTHAAKSEAIRRIMGLDTPGGVIASVTQASRRRLLILPGVNMLSATANGRPAGLGNWDNSCYQNSVLQGLASLDLLTDYLDSTKIGSSMMEEEMPGMEMADALKHLITTLQDPENNGKRIWTPATLKNMSSWQQQDAQEYFSKVFDEIDREIGNFVKTIPQGQGLKRNGSALQDTNTSGTTNSYRNPLEGLTAQRVGCMTCGYSEGLRMVPFNCLTVPLGKMHGHDIRECLDEVTNLEHIEGVNCPKCTLLKFERLLSILVKRSEASGDIDFNQKTRARLAAVNEALEEDDFEDKTLLEKCNIPVKSHVTVTKSRQAVIARPPKSLVLHVNRSVFNEMTGDLMKNYSEVQFPKHLDLGPWCLGSSWADASSVEKWNMDPGNTMVASSQRPSKITGLNYELRAVVTHYGQHENGHYICYRKHPRAIDLDDKDEEENPRPNQWWRLSDDDVVKVTEENVLGQGGVFMLFYDSIEPSTPMSLQEHLPQGSNVHMPPNETVSQESALRKFVDVLPPKTTASSQPQNFEELAHAVIVPLPENDHGDFSDDGIAPMDGGVTTATSVLEFDDDEDSAPNANPYHEEAYRPTQAIVVPPYIPQPGGKSQKDVKGMKGATGSLVMV
ncbi:hypothetical protein BJ875DRAFT_468192 [Amylocarpus encephaloides]|uniref:ubiquitinyl hydrolase 1 n=1 Tax=Amylocarpus encephaloides TaxID=45428 RepID=A0A9P8C2V8_9HELO|nr:hypothetical protein BJ875DRAFT_468192 [Amylocarpus encephaloides]